MAVELASAYVSLLPSFKGGASALQKEAAALGNSASKSMAGEISKSSSRGGSLFSAFAGVAAAGAAIFAGAKIFKGFIDEATEAQVTSAKTAAVLKSTGGAAKVSAGDIGTLATALSLKAGVDDELIQSGANVLLTFTKVRNEAGKGNDIFNQGTSIALDMSKALGTDLQGSVIQVGKALNDPIKGVTALQRVGVSFTAQQKDQIKTMVESGDTLGAQKLILAELNTEFGGAAAASATSGQKLQVAWGNVQETLGNVLLPVLSKVADWLSVLLPKAVTVATKVVGKVGEVIKTAAGDIKLAFQIVTATFAHPDLIADDDGWVGALERLARTARAVWDAISTYFPMVRDAVVGALSAVAQWVSDHWRNVGRGLMSAFDGLKTAITWVIDNQPVLIGVLSALGVGLGVLAVQFVAVQVAAVASGVAAAAAWVVAAAVPIAIGLAIAAVVAGFVWLYQNVDGFRAAVDATWHAIVAAVQWVGDNWRAIWDGIYKYTSMVVKVIADVITVYVNIWRNVISAAVQTIQFIWQHFGDTIVAAIRSAWDFIVGIVQAAMDVVRGIIKVVTSLIHGDWSGAWDGIKQILNGVWEGIKSIVKLALDNLRVVVKLGVDLISLAWGPIEALWTFFRDHVINPIKSGVDALIGGMILAFQFGARMVGVVWDGIKAAVGTPINVVIDFYNRGIAGLWNFVSDHIGGIIGHLPSLGHVFAEGGYTGAGGKYDPAGIVHKGEFVFDQDTTKNLGVDLLTFLLKTKGKGSSRQNTIDPGMFGYAAGGAVRSMEETQAWAQAQAGKPYVFPLTGPGAYDCSGFTSALVNWALGAAYPYTRRHSSGTVGNDPALKPGSGGDRGLTIGAQPPYMISRAGNFVGHTTSSIGTLNAEATPPAVRVGGAARGASALPQQYFLPNFGGPNPSEQGVIDTLRALWHLVVPSAGSTPFAGMLHDLISELPHKVFDFLVTKVPQIIKDALVDVGATGAMSANPIGQAAGVIRSVFDLLGDGGRVVGPSIVGDRGVPEILWNNEGQYVESLGRRSSGGITVEGHIIGDEGFQRFVRREVEALAWRQERRAVSTRVA